MIAPVPFPGQVPVALPVIHHDLEHRYVFVIARIDTGSILYCGPCLYHAAVRLEPGTCYAAAEDEGIARDLVWQLARWFRDQLRDQGRRREKAPDGSGETPKGTAA